MEPIGRLMKDKDLNYIAKVEKAIAHKYGDDAVKNLKSDWDAQKEKEYLKQMKALYKKVKKNEEGKEKVDIEGIKVTKNLLNRKPMRVCPVCNGFPKRARDDVYLTKFDYCYECYIQYVVDREERWESGWRPNKDTEKDS